MQAKRKHKFRIGTRSDEKCGTLYIFGPNKFRASTFTTNHAKAQRRLDSILKDLFFTNREIKTVNDCLDLDADATEERGNCRKSHDYQSKKIREFFGSLGPKNITPGFISGFVSMIEDEGYKKTTANRKLRMLNAAINSAHEYTNKQLELPSCTLTLKGVKEVVRDRVLTDKEIHKILHTLEEPRTVCVSGKGAGTRIDYSNPNVRGERPQPWPFWFKFAIKTAIATSARKAAIIDLTWDRIKGDIIDLENPELKGKRKGRAQVRVAENFLREIEAHQKVSKGKYVVADWDGSRIGAKRLHNYMVALRAQAGITDAVGFHTFRHSMATKALANTETPAQMLEVSKRLGHASITTTERVYSHYRPEFQKNSAITADSFFK